MVEFIETLLSGAEQVAAEFVETLLSPAGIAIVSAVIAWWAVVWARRVAQGNLFAMCLREYSSYEMCVAIRALGRWKSDCDGPNKDNTTERDYVTPWWKNLRINEGEALKLDEYRRFVSMYFYAAEQLLKKHLISQAHFDSMGGKFIESELYKKVVKPMTQKIHDKGYPPLESNPE